MAKLRAVEPGDVPAAPKSVTVAAADGSRRELLVAMRARVATAVEDADTPARDLAALTRRLMEIAKDIEQLDAKDSEDVTDGEATSDAAWEAI